MFIFWSFQQILHHRGWTGQIYAQNWVSLSSWAWLGVMYCCTVECKTNQIFLRHLNAPKRCEEAERIHKWGRSSVVLFRFLRRRVCNEKRIIYSEFSIFTASPGITWYSNRAIFVLGQKRYFSSPKSLLQTKKQNCFCWQWQFFFNTNSWITICIADAVMLLLQTINMCAYWQIF